MNRLQKGFSSIAAIIIVLVIVGGAYFFVSQGYSLNISKEDNNDQTAQTEITTSPTETVMDEETPTPSLEQTGYIEGSLSYPSEFLPDQTVCAENLDTNEKYCTEENIEDAKYTYGKGYLLEVPIGEYHVYAQWEDQKIYYNEFVVCGLNANCPSHDPIAVEVTANSTVTEIDPQDWYNN